MGSLIAIALTIAVSSIGLLLYPIMLLRSSVPPSRNRNGLRIIATRNSFAPMNCLISAAEAWDGPISCANRR